MGKIYDKFLEYINNASEEELAKDWKLLKADNEIGPTVTEYEEKMEEDISSKIDSNTNDTSLLTSLIYHSSWEDGITNDVTDMVNTFYNIYPVKTIFMLTKIADDCKDKNMELDILSGLLRIISTLDKSVRFMDALFPILTRAIRANHTDAQESAIMVIEEWRTKECLDLLLRTPNINSCLVRYKYKIEEELKKELNIK